MRNHHTSCDSLRCRQWTGTSAVVWITSNTFWRVTCCAPGIFRLARTRARATPVVHWCVDKAETGINTVSSASAWTSHGPPTAVLTRTAQWSTPVSFSSCLGYSNRLEVSYCTLSTGYATSTFHHTRLKADFLFPHSAQLISPIT